MTTIAVRDGVMAADCGQIAGGLRRGTINKIERINGKLVGCGGDVSEIEAFAEWLRNPSKERPKFDKDDNFGAITLDENGVSVWDVKCYPQPLDAPYYAIGSGNEVAIGAMAAGKTAEEAVRIACDLDVYSALPVQVEKL